VSAGTLWLIPTPLGEVGAETVLPLPVIERVRSLRYFIAEEPKSARAFLKSVGHPGPMSSLVIERLDHNTSASRLPALLEPVRRGTDAGLVSEAGCPALADPGGNLVRMAHREGLRVVPLSGPSSIVLALMASGLETQRFAFHGYLPVKEPGRSRAIQALEKRSRETGETQIFIETPYRNAALLKALLGACRPDTSLCVATDLTLGSESIATRTVRAWRGVSVDLDRRPSVFLLLAEPLSGAAAGLRPGS
jgi:16S rRNA (cytidine1402-2'-O)-methyltransferase